MAISTLPSLPRRSFRDENAKAMSNENKESEESWEENEFEGDSNGCSFFGGRRLADLIHETLADTRAKVFEVGLKLAYHREPGWRECLPDTVSSTHSRVVIR